MTYLYEVIKSDYPYLLDLDTKAKEKVLYKPVEKLPRIRTTPIFEQFNEKFTKSVQELIS